MSGSTQRVVRARDAAFMCLESGAPDASLALCLHGFPDTPHTWRHLTPALVAAGWRVVAPYLRGFSPTLSAEASRAGPTVLGDDANALHDALGGDERAVVIGHDWGAAAAYAASVADPERWSRVVGASWPPHPADVDLASFDQMRRSWYVFLFQLPQAETIVRDPAFLRSLWESWAPDYDATDDIVASAEALTGPEGANIALAHYRALFGGEPAGPALPSQPTLYLHGTRDGCIGSELVDGLEEHLPGASRVALLEGAGHFPQLEQPAAFNAEVARFLDGTSTNCPAD